MRPLVVATLVALAPAVGLGAGLMPPAAFALAPATVAGPGNPGNPADFVGNPYPTMPWVGITTPYGRFIRYVWVPARAIVFGTDLVRVPGYWVTETTVGYYYPRRWVPEPVGDSYRWVLAPRRFRRR